jgi:hypothetical protein
MSKRTTKKDLLLSLQLYYKKHNKPPKRPSTASLLGYHGCTFARHFGSWNNALEAAKIPLNRKPGRPAIAVQCMSCGAQIERNPSQIR